MRSRAHCFLLALMPGMLRCPPTVHRSRSGVVDPLQCYATRSAIKSKHHTPGILPCRSLYHNCVRAACGHRFCAGCAARCRDCPICGADIQGLEPDAETQGEHGSAFVGIASLSVFCFARRHEEHAARPRRAPTALAVGLHTPLGEARTLPRVVLLRGCSAALRPCAGPTRWMGPSCTVRHDRGHMHSCPPAARVDQYIEAHAGNHTIWELEGASGQEVGTPQRARRMHA